MVRIRACDICYRKKIQCEITRTNEPCNWCTHHGLACTFARATIKRKRERVKLSDVQGLQKRIEQLEGALAQSRKVQIPEKLQHSEDLEPVIDEHDGDDSPQQRRSISHSGSVTSPLPGESSPILPRPQIRLSDRHDRHDSFQENYLGQNWYCKGIAVLSEKGQKWVSQKTNEKMDWRKLKLLNGRQSLAPSALQALECSQSLLQLPSQEWLREILNTFFDSYLQSGFPILHRELFGETIRLCYETIENPLTSEVHTAARACVLATLSLTCRLEGSSDNLIGLDGDICATKAHYLLGRVTRCADVIILQTVLLLQRHYTLTGQMYNAILLHAIACRMVCGLGGHIYRQSKLDDLGMSRPQVRVHHIRNLFWLCYKVDKDISLRFGQPPLLTEDYCDLTPTMPLSSRASSLEIGQSDDELAKDEGSHPSVIELRLTILKEKVCRLLFSPKALRVADSELLLYIRQLDNELEEWRLSIPLEHRPQISISQNHPLVDFKTQNTMGWLALQLEYHYLLTVIHTTVRRCGGDIADGNDMPEDLHTVVHSSTDISLEASRSTICLLGSSIAKSPKESFSIIFYVVVAAMSLFTNILLHPLNPQAQLDIDIIGAAISIIHNMPVYSLTREDIKHMGDLLEFVAELVRLGRCAISKAKREAIS